MKRFLIFLSSGILFILIAAALVVAGGGEKYDMMLSLLSMSVPFLFIGFWNVYIAFDERKMNTADETFTFKEGNKIGIGAFYGKKHIVPVFLVLFGTVVLAIATAFLAFNKPTEDFAIGIFCLSFVYAICITVYYIRKFTRKGTDTDSVSSVSIENDTESKIAVFFASLATLGLFYIAYRFYKRK